MLHIYSENRRIARAEWIEIGIRRAVAIRAGIQDVVNPVLSLEKIKPLKKKGQLVGFFGGPKVNFTSPVVYKTDKIELPPWSGTSLFTFTTKMSAASFSLPAGPVSIESPEDINAVKRNEPSLFKNEETLQGSKQWDSLDPVSAGGIRRKIYGTCPAAVARSVERLDYQKFHEPMSSAAYICDSCYAGKGNYRYPNMAIKQIALLAWVEKTLDEGTFVEQMTAAVKSLQTTETIEILAAKQVTPFFFRIHDAGDFYSEDYYLAWCDVMDRCPEVRFWAPTRMWVFPKFRNIFQERLPENLALRPSALTIDALPPRDLPGQLTPEPVNLETVQNPPPSTNPIATGTMVNSPAVNPAKEGIWPCPAYQATGDHSCANAPRPDGSGIGCRTCWGVDPSLKRTRFGTEVSYPGH